MFLAALTRQSPVHMPCTPVLLLCPEGRESKRLGLPGLRVKETGESLGPRVPGSLGQGPVHVAMGHCNARGKAKCCSSEKHSRKKPAPSLQPLGPQWPLSALHQSLCLGKQVPPAHTLIHPCVAVIEERPITGPGVTLLCPALVAPPPLPGHCHSEGKKRKETSESHFAWQCPVPARLLGALPAPWHPATQCGDILAAPPATHGAVQGLSCSCGMRCWRRWAVYISLLCSTRLVWGAALGSLSTTGHCPYSLASLQHRAEALACLVSSPGGSRAVALWLH